MKQIKSDYIINENSLALLPARQIEFESIVIETDQIIKVRKTQLELIDETCHIECCTYEGRRNAVIHHTNFKRKVPIPINIQKGIYFFPTHSPSDINNKWISYQHIYKIKESSCPSKSNIIFNNGLKLSVKVPYEVLDRQMQRTFECMYRIKRVRNDKPNPQIKVFSHPFN
ncbi:competence protein ComK [Pseudogracilibacillus sp. SO30301A]|uniref:competence protein ComK n=1 Tax=Pseudogracilibacillus sp. SO30301A TaxID=3098291 RepID=UPI00300DE2E5